MGPLGPAGFRRRGRRRGLVVGMAAGAAIANRNNRNDIDEQNYQNDQASDSGGGDDQIAQLEKLGQLRDQGILTEEEFATKKKQILGI
jgi:hypothetical protein